MVPRRWSEMFLVNQDGRVVLQGRCRTKPAPCTKVQSVGNPEDCHAGFLWKRTSMMG